MAPFDIKEVREMMEDDELELDKLGDKRMYSHFLGDFAPIYPLKVAIFNNFAKIRDKARNPRFSSEIALCATFAGTNRPKWKFSVNTASKKTALFCVVSDVDTTL